MPIKGYRKIVFLLSLTGFLNLFLFHAFGAPVFILITLGIWLFLLAVFINHGSWPKFRYVTVAATAILLLNSFILLQRDYWLAIVLLGFSMLVSLGFTTYLFASNLTFFRSLYEILISPLFLGINYLFSGFKVLIFLAFENPLLSKSKLVSVKTWSTVAIGFLIGLPVVVVLLVLLTNADPIFRNFIQLLFNFNIPVQLSQRLIFSLIVLGIFSPLLFLFRGSHLISPIPKVESLSLIHEFTIVMGLVAVTLGAFLVVQAPYIFVSVPFETSLSQFGVATYSEYVRRGFSELLLVGVIIYGLVWAGLLMFRSQSAKRKQYLLYTQMLVLIEFGIFVASLFRRIWLYQSYHGLSLIRIYGSIFLIWLSLITIILALRHFYKKPWVFAEVGITVVIIIFAGFFNAEDLIARYHPPTVNKRIDYVYLSRMSTDGYEGWKMAFDYADDVLNKRGYLDKPLLNREDRRDIAYTGKSLAYLTSNYHNLVHKYGTVEEWQEYYKVIYQYLKQVTQDEIDYLNFYLEPYTPQAPYVHGKLVTDLEKTTKALIEIDERMKYNQSATQKSREISIRSDSVSTAANFNVKPCHRFVELYCQFSFYSLYYPQSGYLYQPGTIDYAFAWNGSQFQAYKQMKQEMPIAELLKLQQAYFSMWYKINSQPKEERDYDIDVSFETPLLGD